MELSWSTFVLEIINFLVLVWILKHFLYQPVLDIISARRKSIDDELAEAQKKQDEAKSLKNDYANRLADWEQERQQLRDKLAEELETERQQQLGELQNRLKAAQEKAEVTESQRRIEAARQAELQALNQGARFAARLLSEASNPKLEAKLVKLLLKDLSSLSDEQLRGLRTRWGDSTDSVNITSAYHLPDAQRQQLEKVLTEVIGKPLQPVYEEDKKLLAGLRISVGAWVLEANLQEELRGFTEFAHATR